MISSLYIENNQMTKYLIVELFDLKFFNQHKLSVQ